MKIFRLSFFLSCVFLGRLFFCGACFSGTDNVSGNALSLSLGDAMEIASVRHPRIAGAESRVMSARERISQTRAGFMPQVVFSETYSRTDNPMWSFGTKLNQETISSMDFDPARLNDPDGIDNFVSKFSAQWPVYDQGKTWYGWQQARLALEVESESSLRVHQEVLANVIRSYTGLLLALSSQELVNQTLETSRAHLKIIRDRYNSGFVIKSDLLRSQVRIADLEQQLFDAQSQVAIATARLQAAMGVPGNDPLVLADTLGPPDPIDPDLEKWLSLAMANRPDYRQLTMRETIAEKEIKKARSAHLPSFTLFGDYEMNTEDFEDFGNNYTVGAMMELPLFSGGRTTANVRESMAMRDEIKAMKKVLELQIRVETRQAFFQAQSAQKRVDTAKIAISQADENLRILKNRYESGLLTIVSLLDAELALQEAQTHYRRALHDYKVSAAELALAAGVLNKDFK